MEYYLICWVKIRIFKQFMARTLKRLLPNTETEIFRNWNDIIGSQVKATNITLCNTSAGAVKVYLSFVVLSGLFLAGAVLNNTTLAAYETITIEITDRIINTDESIRGYASVPDVIALSIDLVGDITPEDDEIFIP